MGKSTLAALLALQLMTLPAMAQSGTGKLTLAGNLVSSSNNADYGVYSFSPTSGDLSVKKLATGNYMNGNGGSVATDATLYVSNYQDYGDGEVFGRLNGYDMTDWSNTFSRSFYGDMSMVATAMTWDASTATIYGCFYNASGRGYEFGILTPTPRPQRSRILSLSKKYVALADNDAGTLYAIDADGDLYTVDESTGSATKIGSTGVTPSGSIQSAVYEPTSGKIYWAAQTNGASTLYEVDPSTATATSLGNFPNGEEFSSIFVSKPAADDNAPSAITGLTTNFEGPSTTGTVSFTIPTTTYGGGELSGNVEWFLIDGDTIANGTAEARAQVTTSPVTLANDYNQLVVVLRNDAGFSPKYKQTVFVGPGTPSGIFNATLSVDDNNLATITWDPSQGNATDGYFVQDSVTYTVVRYPDEVTIAEGLKTTTITDQLPETSGVTTYYYTITPEFMGNKGYAAETNKVNVGSGYTIPYFEDFDEGWIDRYTVLDVNGDYTTWWDSYEGSAYTQAGYDNGSDDWLITPDISFEPGIYKIAFKYWGGLPDNSEFAGNALEVGFGQGTDPANLKIVGKIPNIILTQENRKEFTATVKVDKKGKYNVGIHDVSPSNAYTVYVDSLSITEGGTLSVPDTVSGFKATADADGALSVALSFNAPSKTAGGDALTDLTAITITRDDSTVVKTFENPTPGEALTFTDDATTGLTDGQHHYTVTAENAEGKGMAAYADVVVGIEAPGDAANFTAKDEGKDGIKLSWTAPQQSANGHPLNPESVTYNIYANKYFTSERILVAENVKGTSYTDSVTFDPDGEQLQVYYDIEAANRAGQSEGIISNQIIVGAPDSLPYHEGFDPSLPNQMAHLWWIDLTQDINTMAFFGFQTGASSDGDDGCAVYVGAQDGCFGNLRTGKIALGGSDSPRLTFDYMCNGSEDALLTVQASTDLDEWTDLFTISYDSITATDEWHTAQVDLSSYTEPAYIYLRFHAESNNDESPVIIDNVDIRSDNSTGINSIARNDGKAADVYTLGGKLVRRNATSLNGLPSGVYIFGNRKVIVR